MAAHTYWRLYIGAMAYVYAQMGTVSFLNAAQVNQSTGGTATASSEYNGSWAAGNAFDGNPTSEWASTGVSSSEWIAYQHPSPVDIVFVGVKVSTSYPVSGLALQYSDDGVSWSTASPLYVLAGQPALTSGNYTVLGMSTSRRPLVVVNGQLKELPDGDTLPPQEPAAHSHATSDVTGLDAALSGKQPTISAGTTAQYWRGDKTWRDFFTDVRAATLTGLSTATNAVIDAADTVLAAFGKLQAQITGHTSATSGAHEASAIHVAAVTPATSHSIPAGSVQALLAQNWQDVGGLMEGWDFHTSGVGTQHPASTISNTPAGGISATTVQAAINELDAEKFAKTGGMINAVSATTPTSRGVVTAFANVSDGLSGSSVAAVALGSAQGQKAGYSFWPTFTGTGDNGPRRAADIWASYNGIWGTEKLSLGVGRDGVANDADAVAVEKLAISSGNGASTALFVNNTTFGYGAGAGGTATQTGSRTSGVLLNKPSGQITLVSAAGTTAWQSFTVTNSVVESTDTPIVAQVSGTDLYEIHVTAVATGSFRLSFRTTGGTTTEQPVFKFEIHKGATS